jgi:serine protease Do
MVFAFGSPFDFRFSMSSGIVSGLQRSAGLADIDYENFIQTDAAINPGNSGGPLTDIRGRVIGMNTAIATGRGNSVGQGQFAGIGLAIPMSMIESIVTQIIETGEVRKGFLGVGLMSLDAARAGARSNRLLASIANDFKGEGAVVREVNEGSPADDAGFEFGDVITAIDGQKVTSDGAVPAIISSKRPGAAVEFDIWRIDPEQGAGTVQKLTAKLGELDSAARLAPYLPNALRAAGIEEFSTATDARAKKFGVPFRRGVILEQIRDDAEIASQVPEGSTIVAVFDQQIGSIDEFYTRVNRAVAGMGRVPGFQLPLRIVVPDGSVVQVVVPVR